MSYCYSLPSSMNLHVADRISAEDAARQTVTAREILRRLENQPGLILADEVGMGKTFISLAVAVSVALGDTRRRPVVVMVPPSLRAKWPRDFGVFLDHCVPPELRARLRHKEADDAISFLKALDDPVSRRASLIFASHGAMRPDRRLSDSWVKLAVIQRALAGRWGADELRQTLSQHLGVLLRKSSATHRSPEVWHALLKSSPTKWLEVLRAHDLEPEDEDDPVPQPVLDALEKLSSAEMAEVYEALKAVPKRVSKNLADRLEQARQAISAPIGNLWSNCITSLKLRLPLLVLDEAHHLKNAQTKLASLFQVPDAEADADEIARGPLGRVFERMLFLTATPFQLGHHELCSVLERFNGVAWDGKAAPAAGREKYLEQINELRAALDKAQLATIQLDRAWGKLRAEDLRVGEAPFIDVETWWPEALDSDRLTEKALVVKDQFMTAAGRMKTAEDKLHPWVIRHLKPRHLAEPFRGLARRKSLVGMGAIDGSSGDAGIPVQQEALLPFLLAARAIAVTPSERPVFAEGLASSYEAFLQTRQRTAAVDTDDSVEERSLDQIGKWYLDRLEEKLPLGDSAAMASHPKVAATVQTAVRLWRAGEKVLIFCHYIATGRALRQRISETLEAEIAGAAAAKLGCAPEAVAEHLRLLGDHFEEDRPMRRVCDAEVGAMIDAYAALAGHREDLLRIIRRYVRSRSFLVRFFPLGVTTQPDAFLQALETRDGSGSTLRGLVTSFLEFLAVRCGEAERKDYIEALLSIQPSSFAAKDIEQSFGADELKHVGREHLLANVRLANGDVRAETRSKLMLTFNTPFFPDILISSAVLAEGVDLHRSCLHVIHHDLCWNPSTLEQRTGRVDRIGCKAELSGTPIHVYLPYLAETQDEKMFRVVMDRERWFKVVMGESFKPDLRTTEEIAARVPLPMAAADALAFRLEVREVEVQVPATAEAAVPQL